MFGFDLMFDQLAQPLTVTIPTQNTKARDDSGVGVPDTKPKVVHVSEPLVTNSNPSITFDASVGGEQSTMSMVWESKAFKRVPRHTKVTTADGSTYQVVSMAHTNMSDIAYFQVKAVNGK